MKVGERTDGRTNQAGLAVAMKLDKRTINSHVKSGVIVMDDDGLLHPDKAREQMRQRTHPKAKAYMGDSQTKKIDYHAAKTMREIAEASISRLKYDELSGKLVKKEDGRKVVFDVLRSVRDGMETMATRIAPDLLMSGDVLECTSLINKEVREILNNIANELDRQL